MDDVAEGLRRELERARRDLADLEGEFAEVADPAEVAIDDEHDAEGSTIGFERSRVAGLVARTRRRVASLEEATRRLADGTYQFCSRCRSGIGAERRAALPTTTLCITCARAGTDQPAGQRVASEAAQSLESMPKDGR